MSKDARDREIVELVNSAGKISVEELAIKIFASQSTVRRDLKRLEQQGLLRRLHGGAQSVSSLRPTQVVRHQSNQKEKKLIAARAASYVSEESCIFLDASTTVEYMIPHLSGIKNLTVYTNGAYTAIKLSELGIRVISTGGELLTESMAYVGATAIATVRNIYFDATFFSCAAFDDTSMSDWSEDEAILRRAVIEQSRKRYFLADSSKRGKRFTYTVCQVGELDGIITE